MELNWFVFVDINSFPLLVVLYTSALTRVGVLMRFLLRYAVEKRILDFVFYAKLRKRSVFPFIFQNPSIGTRKK
jgi:hypothetical protein